MSLQVKLSQAREMIERCIRARLVPMLQGSPGGGKSAVIHQIARDYNLKVIDRRLADCDPTDFTGFPNIDIKRAKASYVPMETFPIEGDPIPEGYSGWMLFLDEFNAGDQSVQKAAYKLILDRMVGDHHLHKNVAIVCAGNLETDNAIVEDLSTAMQSRLIHMEMKVDVASWLEWARANHIDHRITSYVQFKPDELFKFDPNHQDKTFACPRTWEFASREIDGIEDLTELDKILLSGTISEGVAREFWGFTKIYKDLPTVKEICAAPNTVPVPTEPSVTWALTGSLGNYATSDNIKSLMEYVVRIPREFQMVALREITRRHKHLGSSPPVADWITQNAHELF